MAHNFFRTQKSQNYTEFIRMAFCIFREFCVKHYTQELSHTAQNFTEFTPHDILCVPWILCEKKGKPDVL